MKIQLDTMEHTDKQFRRYLAENGIAMTLITESGPNGFPLVEYRGERAALVAMIARWFTDDVAEAEELVDALTALDAGAAPAA